MWNKKNEEVQKSIYWILIMLFLISFVGYSLPLINISINNLSGESTTTDLSLLSVFQDSNSLLGSESMLTRERISEVSDVLSTNTQKIKRTMMSFFVSFLIMSIVFIFVITNKYKAITTMVNFGVLLLLIYTGLAIENIYGQLIKSLEEGLGLIASFINISDLISINIGVGYWVIMSSIACLLLVQLIGKKLQETAITASHE